MPINTFSVPVWIWSSHCIPRSEVHSASLIHLPYWQRTALTFSSHTRLPPTPPPPHRMYLKAFLSWLSPFYFHSFSPTFIETNFKSCPCMWCPLLLQATTTLGPVVSFQPAGNLRSVQLHMRRTATRHSITDFIWIKIRYSRVRD